jgi:hypothetical protein
MTAIKCMKSQFQSEEQVNNRREARDPSAATTIALNPKPENLNPKHR